MILDLVASEILTQSVCGRGNIPLTVVFLPLTGCSMAGRSFVAMQCNVLPEIWLAKSSWYSSLPLLMKRRRSSGPQCLRSRICAFISNLSEQPTKALQAINCV